MAGRDGAALRGGLNSSIRSRSSCGGSGAPAKQSRRMRFVVKADAETVSGVALQVAAICARLSLPEPRARRCANGINCTTPLQRMLTYACISAFKDYIHP